MTVRAVPQRTPFARMAAIFCCAAWALAGCSQRAREAVDAYDWGGQCLKQSDLDSAIDSLTEAIRLDPKFVAAYCQRGECYERRGDRTLAMADYQRAVGIDPDSAEAHYRRGKLLAAENEREKALADFSEAIEIDPSFVDAIAARAELYEEAGRFQEAVADRRSVGRLVPEVAVGRGSSADVTTRR